MSIWFYICNFRLNLDDQKAPNNKHSHVWGKKRQKKTKKDKDSIKDKTKKNVQTKCTSIRKTSMFVFWHKAILTT